VARFAGQFEMEVMACSVSKAITEGSLPTGRRAAERL
jgi:hypothetical protein